MQTRAEPHQDRTPTYPRNEPEGEHGKKNQSPTQHQRIMVQGSYVKAASVGCQFWTTIEYDHDRGCSSIRPFAPDYLALCLR
jgi:hypothetical protein